MARSINNGEIAYNQSMPPFYWPEFTRPEHKSLAFSYPPVLVHMKGLFPPVAVEPDLERYRERRARLVPFGQKEQKRASKELYERVESLNRKISHPGARADRIYETIIEAVQFLDHNHAKLIALRTVYNPARSFYQLPDQIKNDPLAVGVMIDVTEALETVNLGDWKAIEQETGEERAQRRESIEDYIKALDNPGLVKFCSATLDILESRRDFWGIELATAITSDAIIVLDRYIGSYNGAQEPMEDT